MLSPRILLIDDHALFRCGLRTMLATCIPDVEVTEAGSLEEGLRNTANPPTLVLLDIQLQGLNGLEGIALIKRKWPEAVVAVLSSDAGAHMVRLAQQRGAAAFMSKAESVDSILTMVDKMRRGISVWPSEDGAMPTRADRPLLTPRQCEVLEWLCRGLSNKGIGRHLGLSEHTVRGHVQAVLAALQVTSRSEAIFAARRIGLVG